MADNKKNIDTEFEDEEKKDQELNEGKDHEQGIEEGPSKTSHKERQPNHFGWKNLSLIIVFLAFIVALGVFYSLGGLSRFTRQDQFSTINIVPSNLSEEILSPFYIQGQSGSEASLIRIDLSIVWDGLASVRFAKIKLQLRNALFEYFNDMASQNQDEFKNMSTDLEAGIQNIICESLNVKGIVVKIKEISCF